MPRKPEVDRPTRLELKLPESQRSRLDLFLFSELENRVPKNAYRDFFTERVREFFDFARLDLTPFGYPEGYFVTGPKDMIAELQRRLVNERQQRAGYTAE